MSENVIPINRPFDAFRAGTGTINSEGQTSFLPNTAVWSDSTAWDEASIPRRPWVVPGYLLRGAVSVLSGPGSAGKSMLTVAYCIAMALGRQFGRFRPAHPGKVLIYNVEDDANEQKRRFSAALRQFSASPSDLAGLILRVGPEQVGTLLRVDPITKRLTITTAMAALETLIADTRPDAVFLDPFVELHDSDENDNTAVRAVMAQLREMAAKYHMAICILHHSRKGVSGLHGDPDSLRGASAIVGAARVVLTVQTMDDKEAAKIEIPEDQRRLYFRVDGAKANYSVVEEAEWYQRVPYDLANGETVAAAEPWIPPDAGHEVSIQDIHRALDAIDKGPEDGVLFTVSTRGGGSRWAGKPLLDLCGMTDKQARAQVATWVRSGLLRETSFRHPLARRDMAGVRVDFTKRPTA